MVPALDIISLGGGGENATDLKKKLFTVSAYYFVYQFHTSEYARIMYKDVHKAFRFSTHLLKSKKSTFGDFTKSVISISKIKGLLGKLFCRFAE